MGPSQADTTAGCRAPRRRELDVLTGLENGARPFACVPPRRGARARAPPMESLAARHAPREQPSKLRALAIGSAANQPAEPPRAKLHCPLSTLRRRCGARAPAASCSAVGQQVQSAHLAPLWTKQLQTSARKLTRQAEGGGRPPPTPGPRAPRDARRPPRKRRGANMGRAFRWLFLTVS